MNLEPWKYFLGNLLEFNMFHFMELALISDYYGDGGG